MICPLCAQPAVLAFEKYGYPICDCTACRHRFADFKPAADHVSSVYADHYFETGGDGYSDYLAEADLLTAHGRTYAALLKKYMKPGVVLDVGAAAGFILNGLVVSGWQGIGLEPNPKMAEYGRSRLGLDVRVGNLEQFECEQPVDLVSMIQVVPHFFDLAQAFEAATRALKPGGYLLIETWNKDSWVARLLGKQWHEYSPPSVLHWFGPDRLASYLSQFGLIEVVRGRPAKKIKAAHAKSLLAYKLQDSPFSGLLKCVSGIVPDPLAIPYPNFDLFWMLLKRPD